MPDTQPAKTELPPLDVLYRVRTRVIAYYERCCLEEDADNAKHWLRVLHEIEKDIQCAKQ